MSCRLSPLHPAGVLLLWLFATSAAPGGALASARRGSLGGSLLIGCGDVPARTVRDGMPGDPYAAAPSYLRSISGRCSVGPLLTVGQMVPGASGQGWFRVLGVPDGMGLRAEAPGPDGKRHARLLVNHEWAATVGLPAGPLPAGARVSEFTLEASGERLRPMVIDGQWAIQHVLAQEPPVPVDPVTHGLAKLCSAFWADERVGFDPPLFLNGEEAPGAETFDGRGGQAWALGNGTAAAFPRLGRAMWENVVVAPFTGQTTMVFGLEDGPDAGDGLHSQLYLYLGSKRPGDPDPLAANGLRGGMLYVACSEDAAHNSEATLQGRSQSTRIRWLPVPWDATDAELDHEAGIAGAFAFVRIEDGACDPVEPGHLYFVTTGKLPRENQPPSCNERGRVYHFEFDPKNPLAGGTLTILLDGTNGIVAPDNVDVNRHGQLAILEDPGHDLKKLGLPRDASVWMYDLHSARLDRIATMNRGAAVHHALHADPANTNDAKADGPGMWETSGIIDAEPFLGRGAWLLTVQAHSLRIDPAPETVQGGQILWLRWR